MSLPSRFLSLPPELLLIILRDIYETPQGICVRPPSLRAISGLRAISTVNRRLRSLCLPLLFRITRCTSSKRFRQLSAECMTNPEFAGLIRELDVVEVQKISGLPGLIPCLTSVARLELPADKLDACLLRAINEHRTLVTAAIHDPELKILADLLSSTDLPFTKLCVSATTTGLDDVTLQAFRAVIERGARFCHFGFEAPRNFELSAATFPIDLPDLEHFDLKMCHHSNISESSIDSWLHSFARRHTQLRTIKFTNAGRYWRDNVVDVPFSRRLGDALRDARVSESSSRLESFTVTKPASWGSLKDWEVAELELEVVKMGRISSILGVVAILAPRLSSLELILQHSRWSTQPIHIDKFEKAFRSMSALRTLHLSNAYPNLHAGGLTPWIPPRRSAARRNVLGTSICVDVLQALTWYMARVVKNAPWLDLIHVYDHGNDKGSGHPGWTLQAAYRVRHNARDLEMLGIPKLDMAPRFLPKN
ncbi:hypothetical protein C8R47DRAFT_633861 [Mycena vitilis]|nr:hypothetical protein C8R47DRAFT_633861 [Mycena vitilis]